MIRAAAEGVATAIVRLQELSGAGWALRLLALISGLAGIAVCWFTAFSFFAPALAGLTLISLLIALVLPDSAAVTASCTFLVLWWLISGAAAPVLAAAALALCLAGLHLGITWSAVAPPHGDLGPRLRRRMVLLGAGYFAVVLVCAFLVIAVSRGAALVPGGLVWIGVAVAAVLGVTLWVRQPRSR